jgi:hypothetical protein
MKIWETLKGKKTYLVAGATILYAVIVVGWQGHDWRAAAEMVLVSMGMGTLRHGMK